ncbi:DUF4235 domain-containing protein [Amycolatopsis rhizosphaerae]|uniref:DUF4235 domain-containing protein n=1 Tax=Amycolatopsis rhizosphaerae TaxID=2053003 RepID=A0A558BK50_9PSEU|nr:DUF4235 domain-containing protein [Amycolatopsis rhizosphaerae]
MKLLYKPLSLVVSALGGVLAGAIFKQSWKAISGEAEAPKATSTEHTLREVLLAAALQGAIFGVVKAAFERGGAEVFHRSTGYDLEKKRISSAEAAPFRGTGSGRAARYRVRRCPPGRRASGRARR